MVRDAAGHDGHVTEREILVQPWTVEGTPPGCRWVSERDLREVIKYFGLLDDFQVINAIIRNAKRLNGLPAGKGDEN